MTIKIKWISCLILFITLTAPVTGQDNSMNDLTALEEGDMNSILDELIGSMEGEPSPAPVMEAAPKPAAAPKKAAVAQKPAAASVPEPMPQEPAGADMGMEGSSVTESDAGMEIGSGEFGMGADSIQTQESSAMGGNGAETYPAEDLGSGSLDSSAVDSIPADVSSQAVSEVSAADSAPVEVLPSSEPAMGQSSWEASPEPSMGQSSWESSPESSMGQSALESSPDLSMGRSATEPAPESLIETQDYSQTEPASETTPSTVGTVPAFSMGGGSELSQSTAIEQPQEIQPVYEQAATNYSDTMSSSSFSDTSFETAVDVTEAKEPTAEEINNRSVAIVREDDEQMMITVGDKIYLPIPRFKTPRLKEFCNIYKKGQKKLFRDQRNFPWYKKVGRMKVIEVNNMYVLGVVMTANDVIQKGDVVYFKP